MKPNRLLLALFIALVPTSLFANTLTFPQVVFGGGYSTTFVITNTGSTAVNSTLNFFTQSGGPRPDLSQPINLAAGNAIRITLPDTGTPFITTVWGEVVAGAGTLQGVATFDLRAPTRVLLTTAGVLGVEPSNRFIIPVDVTANRSTDTGIAIANVNASASVVVGLRLMDENGTQVAATSATIFNPMGARRQTADFVTTWFPQLAGQAFKGTMFVEAGTAAPPNSLTMTALTVKEGILSALPVIPGTSIGTPGSSLYFPQVVFGGGYSTSFVILNTGSARIISTVNFYDQAGNLRADLAQPVNIVAGGAVRFTLPNVGPTTTTVWGEMSPGFGSIRGLASFDLRAGNGVLQTTAGVLGLEAGNVFNLPVDVSASGSALTGVAISNASASPIAISLRLYGENGALFATSADPLFTSFAPKQQTAGFVTQWFPQLAGTNFKGTLVVEAGAGSPAGALTATALTVKEGILSALPVIPGGLTAGGSGGGGGGTGGGGGGTGGGGGLGGPGAASACLLPSVFNSPTTVHLEYVASGSFTGTSISDFISTPNVTFEGQLGTEFSGAQTTSYVGQPTSITRTKSYQRLEGEEIVMLGNTAEITAPLQGTARIVYTPPYRNRRYTLDLGQSSTVTYNTTTYVAFAGLPDLPPTNASVTDTVTYLGRETITIGLGTFETCKFQIAGGGLTWEAVGKGVLIRSTGGGLTLELQSATINGAAVTP